VLPEPTLEEIEARIQTGFSPYGTPDEVTEVPA
jgi:hypothetical protein